MNGMLRVICEKELELSKKWIIKMSGIDKENE